MSTLLTGAQVREEMKSLGLNRDQLVVVDSALEDQFEEEDPQEDETFLAGLQVAVHHLPHDFEFNPELSDSESDANRDAMGVVEARFDELWTIRVNWTPKRQGKIPAAHMLIAYKDEEVAILGPWLTGRTCWHCDAGGWSQFWKKQGIKRGYVLPDHPCPDCGQLDWWDHSQVSPGDFQRACAAEIARTSDVDRDKENRIYKEFAGKNA